MTEPVTIGDATLYLGDCRDILPTLEGVDCVLTDPPYNVGLKYESYDDSMPESRYLQWIWHVFCGCANAGAVNLVWFWQGIRVANGEARDCLPAGFRIHHLSAWFKREFAGDLFKGSHPAFTWEPIIWATCEKTPQYVGPRGGHEGRDCVIGNSSRHDRAAAGHPCPKTESVVCTVLRWIPGGCVLDPMMGAGTTGIAALKDNRKFIGIEIEPKYFDIACERIDREHAQGKLFPQGDNE